MAQNSPGSFRDPRKRSTQILKILEASLKHFLQRFSRYPPSPESYRRFLKEESRKESREEVWQVFIEDSPDAGRQ